MTASRVCSPHKWKRVKDWLGDPNVINGVHVFTYWHCDICGEDTDELPPDAWVEDDSTEHDWQDDYEYNVHYDWED